MAVALMRREPSRVIRRLIVAVAIGAAGLHCATGQAQGPRAAPGSEQAELRLVVDARRAVEVVPDLATIRVGVTADADHEDAALLANAKITAGVIARARASGVEAKDIDADRIKVSPRYETVIVDGLETRGRRIGYAASSTMKVTMRDIPRAGILIRDLLREGANVIEDIQFALTEERMSTVRNEVRASALKAARERAEIAARAAGVRLGRLISVGDPPPPDGAADLGGPPEDPPDLGPALVIEPGVIEIYDTVRAVWILER